MQIHTMPFFLPFPSNLSLLSLLQSQKYKIPLLTLCPFDAPDEKQISKVKYTFYLCAHDWMS